MSNVLSVLRVFECVTKSNSTLAFIGMLGGLNVAEWSMLPFLNGQKSKPNGYNMPFVFEIHHYPQNRFFQTGPQQ